MKLKKSFSIVQVREIWLSSEDTGAYGRDFGTDIAELLRRMAAVLPRDGRTMLRLGMTNPPYMLQHLDAIAEVGCVPMPSTMTKKQFNTIMYIQLS